MGSQGLNSQKSIQFYCGDYKHVEFLRLPHAITMIGYEVKISFQSSDFRFDTIKINTCLLPHFFISITSLTKKPVQKFELTF